MIQKIDHVTINVKNMKKTLEFYGTLLSLERLPTVDMGNHTLSYFKLPDGGRIELTQYRFPTKEGNAEATCKGNARHVAFRVDNIKEIETKLEKAGYHFHSPVAYVEALGCQCGLVKDPNGFEIEFVQYPS